MGNVIAVPSISVLGDETHLIKKCTRLFRNFLATRNNQSTAYSVISLSQLAKDYAQDPDGFARTTKDLYTRYLSRYFDSVDVRVRSISNEDGTYKIALSATVTEDGVKADWERNVDFNSTTMTELLKNINGV